jgi:hypothetical protein
MSVDVRVVIRRGISGELVAEGGFEVLLKELLPSGEISLVGFDHSSETGRRLHLVIRPEVLEHIGSAQLFDHAAAAEDRVLARLGL